MGKNSRETIERLNEKGKERRRFFGAVGWLSFLSSVGVMLAGAVRFAFPNALFEPPTRYRIGRASDFGEGSITFLPERRLFVFRAEGKIRALSAICTHLGCTTKRFGPGDTEYDQVHSHCPCHGSVFARDGKVLKGPAPRPLESYQITTSPEGYLVVDTGKMVPGDWSFGV